LKIRKLITLTMIIAGIVLVVSGVLAATYHYKSYYGVSLSGGLLPPYVHPYISVSNVYHYTSVGLVLGILGLVTLIIEPLLLLVKRER
jgi:hypothetical protein